MVATALLDEFNGAGETETPNVSNCNFGSDDSPNITPATYPITAGNNAFEKWWKMAFTGAFTTIDNLKIWKNSGGYVAGEGIDTNARESAYGGAETYVQPTETTSVIATEVLPETEPSGANLGIAGILAGSLGAPGDSDYLIMQLQTTGATPPGSVNQKSFTFQYDEV
jgi:hypothetical protein